MDWNDQAGFVSRCPFPIPCCIHVLIRAYSEETDSSYHKLIVMFVLSDVARNKSAIRSSAVCRTTIRSRQRVSVGSRSLEPSRCDSVLVASGFVDPPEPLVDNAWDFG